MKDALNRFAPPFLLGLVLLLGWRGTDEPIGMGDFAGAQDEAHYSNAAIRMAREGDWMTPYFMDRFYLYKPPMVYWLSALSVKLTGVSRDVLRRPARIAAATTVIVYLFAGGGWGGLFGAVALCSSPMVFNLGHRNMTDTLLCLWVTVAAWLLARDLKMVKPTSWIGFGVITGLAILTKSTAGLIPPMIAGALWLLHRDWRVLGRLAMAGLIAALVAAPWFLYQYVVHPRWFWEEFVGIELLAYGAGAPPQYSHSTALSFYLGKLWMGAKVVLVWAAVALLWFVVKLRAREAEALTLAAWLLIIACAIGGYQYRNETYLLPALPALAILAGRYACPWSFPVMIAMLVVPRIGVSEDPISLHLSTRPLLEQECDSGRSNELVVVDAIDSFHATVLPLSKVRYALEGTGQPPKGFALDFRSMGIAMPVGEFLDLDRHRARYAAVLRDWGLPNDKALATVVAFPDAEALQQLIDGSPDRDFLLSPRRSDLKSMVHRRVERIDHILLLGRDLPPRPEKPWGCAM